MSNIKIDIDRLIDIVRQGGSAYTDVDLHNKSGVLLLSRDVPLDNVSTLLHIKNNGILEIPINSGGLWDQHGRKIPCELEIEQSQAFSSSFADPDIDKKIRDIFELKKDAARMYEKAKENIKRVISDIKNTGGEFDFVQVENTVKDLFNFINRSDSAFIYLTKEIFSYDDYLYNHSINVCTIAAAVLKRFNEQFSAAINSFLSHTAFETPAKNRHSNGNSFIYYLPEEQHDMAVGFFLHDVGKVLIPDEILNKTGKLTSEEFEIVKKHSFEKGLKILDQNGVQNPLIANIVKYHHGPLLQGEDRCYPEDKLPIEIPTYVKICKLADIYDAMTSKRSYKDALNPIGVVTDIFRKYAEKDRVLHFILHSFVNIVGIYPAGSIVCLKNRQMAFIIDSDGPIVIPFTDAQCNSLRNRPDPIDLGKPNSGNPQIKIDTRKPLISPAEAYKLLPAYLKASVDQ